MNLSEADQQAADVVRVLKPLCARIEIAGSIRRRKLGDIKDIEIVLQADPAKMTELAKAINTTWGRPAMGAWPSKYTKIRSSYNIDIFTASKETWGLCLFIRTGCAKFSESGLAAWKRISNGGYSANCQLHQADGTIMPTPEEADVFRALNMRFIPPKERI